MGNPKYDKPTPTGTTMDVYDVLEAFTVTCPALQHLTKKSLNIGSRGFKDVMQDLIDIRDSAERAIGLELSRQTKRSLHK